MKNILASLARRRQALGDKKGFSLVELAVVIVVIGILVAIAVPVFGSIQNGAHSAQLKAAAANGSSAVASAIAIGETDANVRTAAASAASADMTVTVTPATPTALTLSNYCVSVDFTDEIDGVDAFEKGPGC